MRTLFTQDFSQPILARSVLTIGNFDGVHRGHREIFRTLQQRAAASGAASAVITFNPHPLHLFCPERAPLLITTLEQKRALIAESDIDLLLVIPFDLQFASRSAESFVRDVLKGALGVEHLVIGHDYAFGRNREGDEALLSRLAGELDFMVEALDPVGDGGLIFSSSAVRRMVSAGQVAEAIAILGRCHRIAGTVVRGREIGRVLGFPTANIATENQLLPCDGVYAVWVEVAGELHMGACSVGVNPTFGGVVRSLEVFVLDFDAPLYEQQVTVHFVQRLRAIVRFASGDELRRQIADDVATVRRVLAVGLPERCDA